MCFCLASERRVLPQDGDSNSHRRAISRGGVTGVTTFAFRGVCQHREYVIVSEAGEILQDLILTHTPRQIFENIGGCDPSADDARLAAAYTGSDLNVLCQFMCFPPVPRVS